MRDLRIGLFLGLRQIQRANLWTTLLIIVVILFTFLNLVALSGILIGIVDGAMKGVRSEAIGDLTINPLDGETRIKETERFIEELKTYPEVYSFTQRYTGLATIEANYKERRNLSAEPDVIAVAITGIDVLAEEATTNLSKLVKEGSYLDPNESGYILIGKYNIDRYAAEFGDVFDSLKNVYPGDSVMVTVGDQSREFIVKGIVESKVDLVSVSVFIPELEFKRMFDRADYNANQIAVKLKAGYDEKVVRDQLQKSDLVKLAEIHSFTEDVPKFIIDVRKTFDILGVFTGAIGLIVASITIFIVIFINALSRRRQIGILKAVGITRRTIEYAYITQAAFYAIIGSILGILITYYVLIPYFNQNPIDFPFSNASLSISLEGMYIRAGALLVVTLIAGFVPAWMITRQNTLNSILGRK
ncbi:MAG: FtsX-like permease family protein [Candidatus Paceibacterota bacterium]